MTLGKIWQWRRPLVASFLLGAVVVLGGCKGEPPEPTKKEIKKSQELHEEAAQREMDENQ